MIKTKKVIRKGDVFIVFLCLFILLAAWKSDNRKRAFQFKMGSIYNGQALIITPINFSALDIPSNIPLTNSITPSVVDTSKDSMETSDQNKDGTIPHKGATKQTADETISYMGWIINVLPILISIIALFVSLWHHFTDDRRSKKKDTLDAYNDLQETVFDELNKLRKEHPVLEASRRTAYRKLVTNSLARIERFSVGVNCGIYDIKVLKRCGGNYFIRTYFYLKVIIDDKRNEKNDLGGKHYDEFESVTNDLIKMYEKEGINILPFKTATINNEKEQEA